MAYLLVVIPDFASLVDQLVVQLRALHTARPLVVTQKEMVPEPVNESLYRQTARRVAKQKRMGKKERLNERSSCFFPGGSFSFWLNVSWQWMS